MDIFEEVFVPVENFPNYVVSNYGRVCNANRNSDLSPAPDGNGYLKVALYREGVRYDIYLHRLVAKAFFLNYREGIVVKHINGDKGENTVLNLTIGPGRCRVAEVPLW